MGQVLFSDSETFTKERPRKMTEKQSKKLYMELAKEVIKEGWSDSEPETIAEYLEDIPMYLSNGYERAKYLDDHHFWSGIDTPFIEWLDTFNDSINDVIKSNVQAWVKAHNIQPKFKKGDALTVLRDLGYTYKPDQVIHITTVYPDDATYTVHANPDRMGGYVFAFEKVESACELLK